MSRIILSLVLLKTDDMFLFIQSPIKTFSGKSGVQGHKSTDMERVLLLSGAESYTFQTGKREGS
jgi:hypothetical protein